MHELLFQLQGLFILVVNWFWGDCLQDRPAWHYGLLPGRGLQPALCWWLCGLIRGAAGPWASMDPGVPNRSGAINNRPICCGRLGSDVAGRTSVKVRVRIGEPGALWFWCGAIGRHACSASLCLSLCIQMGWCDELICLYVKGLFRMEVFKSICMLILLLFFHMVAPRF